MTCKGHPPIVRKGETLFSDPDLKILNTIRCHKNYGLRSIGEKRGNACEENNYQLHLLAKQILGFSRFDSNGVGLSEKCHLYLKPVPLSGA